MTNSSVSYYEQWLRISPLEDLQPNQINNFYFLGENIVVWKPHSSTKYSVFIDECPYCKVPLKTGYINERIENLVCGDKGCQFDTQGICIYKVNTGNPEFINSEFIANDSHKNPLFQSVTILKIKEENGLLMGYVPGGIFTTHHIERWD